MPEYSPEVRASLDRYGFEDPYDPRFLRLCVFGEAMRNSAVRWPHVDFSELAAVNPDVCGWIHMDGCPLSYPVVNAREDPGYYLMHNFSREESFHGAVALSRECAGAIGGRNTVLTAHTMRDWTMFRSVRALCDQTYLDSHPNVWLLSSDGARWRGRWFAAARFNRWQPWPTRVRFGDDAEFAAWLARVLDGNWLRTGVEPDSQSHVLTCVTCAMTPGEYSMRAVFAVLEPHDAS